MVQNPLSPQPIKNPQTSMRHRKEVFWQITLPLVIAIVITITVASLVVFSTTAGAKSQLADIALIQLIIPALFFSLISLVMLGGFIYGLVKLYQVLPEFFLRGLVFLLRVQLGVAKFNNRLTEPIIRMHIYNARRHALRRSIQREFRR